MYICEECESCFNEAVMEDMGAVPYGDTYVSMGECCTCPDCGSEDIAEARKCKCCGEYKAESELESGFCEACRIEMLKDFEIMLKDRFSPEQIEFIKEAWYESC